MSSNQRFGAAIMWSRSYVAGAAAGTPAAHAAEDSVTYEVFSPFVPVVASIEYRDVS